MARQSTLILAPNPRAGERNHVSHLAQGCHFSNTTQPPFQGGCSKEQTRNTLQLKKKKKKEKAGVWHILNLQCMLLHLDMTTLSRLDKPVNTDIIQDRGD